MSKHLYPHSIREINDLHEDDKISIYKSLIPDWVYKQFAIDADTLMKDGQRVVTFRCPPKTRAVEITIKQDAADIDPMVYLHLADNMNNQLQVLLVQVNDPSEPRFDIDVDADGNPTNFGTTGRNISAELAAMAYGLAPGQVRAGLRGFRKMVPVFEAFISNMGHEMFFVEPMSYHNAIMFERYGFNYLRGQAEMQRIHEAFTPDDGELYLRLVDDNPFRQPDAWSTVRGRSWAIHDGILGRPFTGVQMYKHVGRHAKISTCAQVEW